MYVGKRLVLYVGYDVKSRDVLNKVSKIKTLFDEVRIIYIPEVDDEILSKYSLPSIKIESFGDVDEDSKVDIPRFTSLIEESLMNY